MVLQRASCFELRYVTCKQLPRGGRERVLSARRNAGVGSTLDAMAISMWKRGDEIVEINEVPAGEFVAWNTTLVSLAVQGNDHPYFDSVEEAEAALAAAGWERQ